MLKISDSLIILEPLEYWFLLGGSAKGEFILACLIDFKLQILQPAKTKKKVHRTVRFYI